MAASDYRIPLPEALRMQVFQALDEAWQKAQTALDYRAAKPELSFDLRSGSMAARAYPFENRIEFNKVILRNNPNDAFILDTVAHELAHIVATRLYRSRGHDRYWKAVAVTLGAEPKASGHFDTANAQARVRQPARKYPFHCACQVFEFGRQRLNNYLKGSRYQCRSCKGEILPNLSREEAFDGVSYAKLRRRKR